MLDILKEPKQSIPSFSYGLPTTNTYIHLAQILKQATTPPAYTPIPPIKQPVPLPSLIL